MPIHGKQHPDCQRKPINYDRDSPYSEKKKKIALCTAVLLSVLLHHTYNDDMVS